MDLYIGNLLVGSIDELTYIKSTVLTCSQVLETTHRTAKYYIQAGQRLGC